MSLTRFKNVIFSKIQNKPKTLEILFVIMRVNDC